MLLLSKQDCILGTNISKIQIHFMRTLALWTIHVAHIKCLNEKLNIQVPFLRNFSAIIIKFVRFDFLVWLDTLLELKKIFIYQLSKNSIKFIEFIFIKI
jgi:hypothetical protein